ncbi:AAA family ATPase [Aquabacterium sp. UBA2148]|uniref:AAA family ATPase n=1 Tax=Aquabacterium sp. UBA2148 TaxID=1946042 RepID=UPI00257D265B|nr:AAA family ATPase [Aquabacterium sp. UBA2148]
MNTSASHRLGLVVGKFSPLHLGHEHVIGRAQQACEQVLVLGYSQPSFAGCERARREAWVQRRFPGVINIQIDDDWVRARCAERGLPWRPMPDNLASDEAQQDWLAWLLDGPIGLRPDAMFASEPYLGPTCERLARTWAQPVTPVSVDPHRARHPISARTLRQDVHAHRTWLHADVYRDFVQRVVLLGGESSGKTTLAEALAQAEGTVWVPEHGRDRWLACGGQLTLQDLVDIAQTQVAHEEARLSQAHRWLVCDTSPLTTWGYAGWMFQQQPPELTQAAMRRYDLIVLCEPDFGFVQDGTRRGADFQREQHAWYEAQLLQRTEPVLRVGGPLAQRVAQVQAALAELSQRGVQPGDPAEPPDPPEPS